MTSRPSKRNVPRSAGCVPEIALISVDLAAMHLEVDVDERLDGPEALADAVALEQRLGGAALRRGRPTVGYDEGHTTTLAERA